MVVPICRAEDIEVDLNYEAFSRLLPELLLKHENQYVLMRNGSVESIFDTMRDAVVAASKLFDDDLYSVQKITDEPVNLGFFSYAAINGNT